MSLRTLICSALLQVCILAALHAQNSFLKAIAWGEPLGNNYTQRLKPATGEGAWLLAGPTNDAGPATPSQLIRLGADGNPVGVARKIQNAFNSPGAVLLDFAESASGEKYAFILTDESPFPTVVVGAQLFLAKFDANWNPLWVRSLNQLGTNLASAHFRLRVTQEGWACVHAIIAAEYTLACFTPEGALAWSTSQSTGAQGLGLVLISSGIVLSADESKVLFHSYFELGNRMRLRLYDRISGQLVAAKDISDINITSAMATPDGGFWALGRQSAASSECLAVKLDASLALTAGWVVTESQARANRTLLWADDSTFVALIDGFQSSVLLRANQAGELLKGVQYRGLSDITPIRADAVSQGTEFWLAASRRPQSTNSSLLLRMDTSLVLPACAGAPWCGLLRPATLTEVSVQPSFGGVNVTATQAVFVWAQGLAAGVSAFCEDTPALIGVSATFNLPDTVCAGVSLRPDQLENGGASSALWDFGPGMPATFSGLTPPEVRFDTPGRFTIRQIAISECVQDTFTRELVVLDRPQISLPTSLSFCKDTTIILQPQLTNATTWTWSDGWPELNRAVNSSGLYSLSATNQGFCEVSQSLEVIITVLDAAFSLPDLTCRLDPLTLQTPPQAPGTQWTWQINPPIPNWPANAAEIEVIWPSAETYTITLSLENNNCTLSQTLLIDVLATPGVRIGDDFRLGEGAQQIVRPTISPANASYLWQDGTPELNRIITDPGVYILVAELGQCRASDTLRVLPEVRVYQPNIFRPGGIENELFRVYPGAGVQVESLDIFDRWGSLVFSGQGPDAAWDGLVRGKPANVGVYVYVSRLRLDEGEGINIYGDVTLVR